MKHLRRFAQTLRIDSADQIGRQIQTDDGLGYQIRKIHQIVVRQIEKVQLDVVAKGHGWHGLEAVRREIEYLQSQELGEGALVQALEVIVVEKQVSQHDVLSEDVVG